MNHQIPPADIRPLKGEIIVKKYLKPARVGSLFLPSQSLEDRTGTLWEVVRSSEKADEEFGAPLFRGDIVKVPWGHVTSLGTDDPADGRSMYVVHPDHIYHRIMNTWDTPSEEE